MPKDGRSWIRWLLRAMQQRVINLADVYQADGFDFSTTRAFDQRMQYRSQSMLTIPLRNHEQQVIGVLQLINAKAISGDQVVPFSPISVKIATSLALKQPCCCLVKIWSMIWLSFLRALCNSLPMPLTPSRLIPAVIVGG